MSLDTLLWSGDHARTHRTAGWRHMFTVDDAIRHHESEELAADIAAERALNTVPRQDP